METIYLEKVTYEIYLEKYIWRNIFGEGRLPMKCSEPMLLAKREAPTGIQCMFLQKIFKLKDEIGKETDLEKNVTWMQGKNR